MSNNTTNMSLKKAVDADNSEVYLVTNLAGSLDTIDAHTHGGGALGLPAALTNSSTHISADVTMVTANTYYDGPSLTLAAGTWLLIGGVEVSTGGSADSIVAKLWDGTTVVDASGASVPIGSSQRLNVQGIVSPVGSTTYKISAASNTGTSNAAIKAALPTSSPGNFGSGLVAVRIA